MFAETYFSHLRDSVIKKMATVIAAELFAVLEVIYSTFFTFSNGLIILIHFRRWNSMLPPTLTDKTHRYEGVCGSQKWLFLALWYLWTNQKERNFIWALHVSGAYHALGRFEKLRDNRNRISALASTRSADDERTKAGGLFFLQFFNLECLQFPTEFSRFNLFCSWLRLSSSFIKTKRIKMVVRKEWKRCAWKGNILCG